MSWTLAVFLTETSADHGDRPAIKLDETVVSYAQLDVGSGRVAAMEIVAATPAVRECLRDSARTAELQKLMKSDETMQTLKQHLDELVRDGAVAKETARVTASAP